jgi:hypothetical protein
MRCASSTLPRNSRDQAWLSACTAANSTATHITPPAYCREVSWVGSKASENSTTTSSA